MSIVPISAEYNNPHTRKWVFSKSAQTPPAVQYSEQQQQVISHDSGALLVLGGPGTGKTSVLAETIAARIKSGVNPESIVVLTFNHAAAADLKLEITRRTGGGFSPVITTFHSLALSILQEFWEVEPLPTLITASAQEVLLKELLLGISEEPLIAQNVRIPLDMMPSLSTKAMIIEIRNAIARAQVLGFDPLSLSLLVAADERWTAVADIYRMYVAQLETQNLLDYNQLVLSLRNQLKDPAIKSRLQSRLQYVYIDEYQDIDPLQVAIIADMVNPSGAIVAFADPDQAIYQFRGAAESAVMSFTADYGHLLNAPKVIGFQENFRSVAPIQNTLDLAIERNSNFAVFSKYQISTRSAAANAEFSGISKQVSFAGYETAEAEATAIAERIRELVLSSNQQLTWSDVAVLVRRGSSSIPTIQKALVAADVPVSVVFDDVPIAEETEVKVFISALLAVHQPSRLKDPYLARELLTSPIGNFSINDLRYLGRELKRHFRAQPGAFSEQLVADALADVDFEADIQDPKARDLLVRVRNLHDLIATTSRAARNSEPVSELLWRIWKSPIHDWSNQLRNRALGDGYAAAVANHSLDAIKTLFKVASDDAAAVRSHTSIPNFIAELRSMEVGSQKSTTAIKPDTVSLMTAHQAKGKQWLAVFIASLDEGSWPDVTRRSSIFAPDRLTADGLGYLPERYEIVNAERRLFYTAIARARAILHVSHTSSDPDSGKVMSRFLKPFLADFQQSLEAGTGFESNSPAFSINALVSQLRRTAVAESVSSELKAAAINRLAYLAQLRDKSGRLLVPAAHPAAWWGIAELTSNLKPIVDLEDPVYVRGSSFADLLNCPLNWFMKQKAAADVGGSVAANFGSLVHAVAAGIVDGDIAADENVYRAKFDEHWKSLRYGAEWESETQKLDAIRSIRNFLHWRNERMSQLAKLGKVEFTESFFDAVVDFPLTTGGSDRLRLRGSIDLIQVEADGRVFIADIKTSTGATDSAEVQVNPQLGVYQKAVDLGLVDLAGIEIESKLESAGAALLFVRDRAKKTIGPTVRNQAALAEAETDWMDENFRIAIEVVRTENHTPIVSKSCKYCPVRTSCPTTAVGKSVI